MKDNRRSEPLGQGGPSDQASQRDDARDDGDIGAQSGRPQAQHRPADDAGKGASAAGKSPRAPARGDDDAMSETERQAGTPDERATTDWRHGEGEPGPEAARSDTAKLRGRPSD